MSHTQAGVLQPDPTRFSRPLRLRPTRPRAGSSETSSSSAASSSKGLPLSVDDPTRLRSRSSPRLPGSPLRHASSFDEDEENADGVESNLSSQPSLPPWSPPESPEKLPLGYFADVPKHRHGGALFEALSTLLQFTSQPISVHETSLSVHRRVDSFNEPLRAGLEHDGWTYAGTRQGVRIFSKAVSDGEVQRQPLSRSVKGKGKAANGPQASDSHQDTSLPYYRGEGWLPGSWRPSDVAATFRSVPTRASFEPHLNAGRSGLVQILDESNGDALVYQFYRDAFPVGQRDFSFVSGYREVPLSSFEDSSRSVKGLAVSTSVMDSLLPDIDGVQRSWTHLSGLAIHPMAKAPLYDTPDYPPHIYSMSATQSRRASLDTFGSRPSSQVNGLPIFDSPGGKPPTLSRQSALSSASPTFRMSWGNGRPMSSPVAMESAEWSNASPPNSPLGGRHRAQSMITGSRRRPDRLSKQLPSMASSILPALLSRPQSPNGTMDRESETTDRPGCHLTFVTRVDPMGKLPVTYVNQMSLTIPLMVANLTRHITKYGFTPHLCRQTSAAGVHVLGEEFDVTGLYKIQYTLRGEASGGTTRIRFHGLTFGRGQFEVEVLPTPEWRIEFDHPDIEGEYDEDAPALMMQKLPPDTKSRRSSIRMTPAPKSSPPLIRTPTSPLSVQIDPHTGTLRPTDKGIDSATLPGARGGCTLIVENTVIGPTIQVILRKSSEKQIPLLGIQRAMDSIGRDLCNHKQNEDRLRKPSSIEDLTILGRAKLSISAGRRSRQEPSNMSTSSSTNALTIR